MEFIASEYGLQVSGRDLIRHAGRVVRGARLAAEAAPTGNCRCSGSSASTSTTTSCGASIRPASAKWRAWRKAQVSPSTIRREEALLKHVMTTAVPSYLDSNPLAGMKRPCRRDGYPRALPRRGAPTPGGADRPAGPRGALRLGYPASPLERARPGAKAGPPHAPVPSDTKAKAVRIPSQTASGRLDALPMTGPHYFPRCDDRQQPRDPDVQGGLPGREGAACSEGGRRLVSITQTHGRDAHARERRGPEDGDGDRRVALTCGHGALPSERGSEARGGQCDCLTTTTRLRPARNVEPLTSHTSMA